MGNIAGRESAAERLAADLRRRILNGELAPGLRLPPERSLAIEWEANRHTVREALRLLEAQGLLETRQGSGVTILDFRARGRLELAPYYFEAIGLDPAILPEIEAFFTLRRLLLLEAAGLAARDGSPAGRRKVGQLTQEIEASRQDARRVVELDFALYGAIIEATGRLLYRWALNSFAERVQPLMESLAYLWPQPDNYFVTIIRMGQRVAAGDVTGAKEAARAHLEETDAQVLETISKVLGVAQNAARG
jgi:GntR family transcriptional regulator, transcriptional repressor for pyruvate dehydrogenase complex